MTDENGLYYMRARYYDPKMKRFINQDVLRGNIGNGQSLNRYAYVNGNPVSYVDPLGLYRWSEFGQDMLYIGGSALDIAGGIGKAIAAGGVYATATLAGGGLSSIGRLGYVYGTALASGAISDFDDSSKKLTAAINNVFISGLTNSAFGTNFSRRSEGQIEGIFSKLTEDSDIGPYMKANQTAFDVVDVYKNIEDIVKGGRKIFQKIKNGNLTDIINTRQKRELYSWEYMVGKTTKYKMGKVPNIMMMSGLEAIDSRQNIIENSKEMCTDH